MLQFRTAVRKGTGGLIQHRLRRQRMPLVAVTMENSRNNGVNTLLLLLV